MNARKTLISVICLCTASLLIFSYVKDSFFISERYSYRQFVLLEILLTALFIAIFAGIFILNKQRSVKAKICIFAAMLLVWSAAHSGGQYTLTMHEAKLEMISDTAVYKIKSGDKTLNAVILADKEIEENGEYSYIDVDYHYNYLGSQCYIKEVGPFSGD